MCRLRSETVAKLNMTDLVYDTIKTKPNEERVMKKLKTKNEMLRTNGQ